MGVPSTFSSRTKTARPLALWPVTTVRTFIPCLFSSGSHRRAHVVELQEIADKHFCAHLFQPFRAVIFAMGQRPHRMSSLQQPLDRATAGVAGRTRHQEFLLCHDLSFLGTWLSKAPQ